MVLNAKLQICFISSARNKATAVSEERIKIVQQEHLVPNVYAFVCLFINPHVLTDHDLILYTHRLNTWSKRKLGDKPSNPFMEFDTIYFLFVTMICIYLLFNLLQFNVCAITVCSIIICVQFFSVFLCSCVFVFS